MNQVNLILLGAIAMASVTAGLFFLRFWKKTGDRFFLFFAVSFCLEGLNRALLGLTANPDEGIPFFYLIRLFAFVIILVAIADKNWSKKKRTKTSDEGRNLRE